MNFKVCYTDRSNQYSVIVNADSLKKAVEMVESRVDGCFLFAAAPESMTKDDWDKFEKDAKWIT